MSFDPVWEAQHAARRWGQWPTEHLVRFVMQKYGSFARRENVNFIDLGCGAGASSLFLLREEFSVLAIDGSASAIQRLQAAAQQDAGMPHGALDRLVVYIADLTAEIFGYDESADCCIDICTLQHLPFDDARSVITKALGWLKPNGRFFSMMASLEHFDDGSPLAPRTVGEFKLMELWEGWELKFGKDVCRRPGGIQTGHWIVEAVKP